LRLHGNSEANVARKWLDAVGLGVVDSTSLLDAELVANREKAALIVGIGSSADGSSGEVVIGGAVILITGADLWDVTCIAGRAANGGVALVSVCGAASSCSAVLRGVARTARSATFRVDGLETVSRADMGRTSAQFSNITISVGLTANGCVGSDEITGAVGRASGAVLGDIAVTGRGTANGVEGLQGIGRAGGGVARAGLLDIARAESRAADAVLEPIGGALSTITVAVLGLVTLTGGRSQGDGGCSCTCPGSRLPAGNHRCAACWSRTQSQRCN
jgi:hypothetical protein